MTLKEELELLRGESIRVSSGDPMDIPCVETSDPERLCRHPVVSVHMITYNHEPYIRQAIEGVMMQKTDFEFELVIGEDCSTDKTREICFEYQKRHPDKIRVLWCDHNLYRNPHPAGGNTARNMAHCRGEFIAACEGDDYWIDPLKLQKQVDAMRRHPSVGLCFCGAKTHYVVKGEFCDWCGGRAFTPGFIEGRKLALWYMFGGSRHEWFGPGKCGFLMTAGLMMRTSTLRQAAESEEIFTWGLALGDATTILGLLQRSDAFYLPDVVSVYRQVATGACHSNTMVGVDGMTVRWYFSRRIFGLGIGDTTGNLISYAYWALLNRLASMPWRVRVVTGGRIIRHLKRYGRFSDIHYLPLRIAMVTGFVSPVALRFASWWVRCHCFVADIPNRVAALYDQYGEAS